MADQVEVSEGFLQVKIKMPQALVVGFEGPARNEPERYLRVALAHGLSDFVTRHLGQTEVEQHEVVAPLGKLIECLHAVTRYLYLVLACQKSA